MKQAFLALLVAASASAGTIAYDYSSQPGNQQFSGALGMDFDVNQTISITNLGAFDGGADGLARTITVYIYNRNTQTSVASLSITGSSGTLVGGGRFVALGSALVLNPGFQGSIVAENYGPTEQNGNAGFAGFAVSTLNTGGGAISFVGTSRFSGVAGIFPAQNFAGVSNAFGAGTFQFDVVQAGVPEPAPLVLTAVALLGMAGLRLMRGQVRRRADGQVKPR